MSLNEPSSRPRKPRPKPPREYLLYLLKRRLYSEAELTVRLRRRQVEPAEIEAVIGELKTVGLIDDQRYAKVFVEERTRLNPMGKRRIYFELIKRGIAKELAKEAIEGIDEAELVEALRDRIKHRWERLEGEEWAKKQKLLRFLASRGVGYGQAKELVEEVLGPTS